MSQHVERRRGRPSPVRAGAALAAVGAAILLAHQVRGGRPGGTGDRCCAGAPSRQKLHASSGGTGRSPAPAGAQGDDRSAPEGMVWIPGGTFAMGSDDPKMADARPWHEVTVDGFWMDRTEVTNEEFARFVEATGYVTTAERPLDAALYPGASADDLRPSGIVFTPPSHPVDLRDPMAWWRSVPGASFRHPEGPGSAIAGRERDPVVQVSWDDAVAYAAWAGKRLPTEAEWERAARGGLVRKPFVWGDERTPGGRWLANVWQGRFPSENTRADGFAGVAPVGSFPPNGFGLYDMAGNVWEWTADWYRPDTYASSPEENPRGPADGFDPDEPGVAKRVTRGGSFLCSDAYCGRYQPGGRGKAAPDSGTSHTGFRCVRAPGAATNGRE